MEVMARRTVTRKHGSWIDQRHTISQLLMGLLSWIIIFAKTARSDVYVKALLVKQRLAGLLRAMLFSLLAIGFWMHQCRWRICYDR